MVSLLIAGCSSAETISSKKSAVVAIGSAKTVDNEIKSGLGTGWLLNENYIVTNYHVIEDSEALMIAPENGKMEYEAELVYGDKISDIAVIRLKDWEKFKKENEISYLKIAGKDSINDADPVYSIGHPWGLSWTISKGIVSSEMRRVSSAPGYMIQTDAHIFNGNSGGPLLNESGEVIGVNNSMIANTGGSFGMAIPAPMVRKVLRDLEKYNEVRWCVIGVLLEDGLKIKEIVADSPAEKAGLLPGDIITEINVNGNILRDPTVNQAISEINLCDVSKPIEIIVERGDGIAKFKLDPDYKLSSSYQSESTHHKSETSP